MNNAGAKTTERVRIAVDEYLGGDDGTAAPPLGCKAVARELADLIKQHSTG